MAIHLFQQYDISGAKKSSKSTNQRLHQVLTKFGAILTILASLLVLPLQAAQATPSDIIVLSDGTVRAWDATANGTPSGWEQTGFDDSAWSFAQETPCNAYSDWPAPYPYDITNDVCQVPFRRRRGATDSRLD